MRVKVRGGTVEHGQVSLCETCRWSTIVRGIGFHDEIVECNELSFRNQRVPFPVVSCSKYLNSNHPTLRAMEDIAWILRSHPHRNQLGFVPSSRLPDDARYVLEED